MPTKKKAYKTYLDNTQVAALNDIKRPAETESNFVFAAIKAEVLRRGGEWPGKKAQHGGQRYHQCQQCKGWNVGTLGDGIFRCADCGWSSDDTAEVMREFEAMVNQLISELETEAYD